jgi:putative FmdB family regulatory protein
VCALVPEATIGLAMPMYEFECEECGARFEDLVPVGTESIPCPECSSERTRRAFSAPGAPMKLVQSRGEQRRQETKNAQLHQATKARFKEARRKAREARNRGGPPGSA